MEHRVLLPIKLFFIVLLCSCYNASKKIIPNEAVNRTNASLNNNNGTVLFKGKTFTGIIFTLYDPSSDTAEIQQYRNGKEDGVWKKYYPGGQLKELREFSNGYKTGDQKQWWPNGNKLLEYHFVNDEYEGTCLEWNMKGLLTKKMNYKAGHEDGSQQWWYDNGKIKANYTIINNRRYGLLGTKNCVNVSDSIFKN